MSRKLLTRDRRAVLFCILYFLGCAYCMVMCQLYVEFKLHTTMVEPLHDLLFDFVREVPSSETLVEVAVNGALIYIMCRGISLSATRTRFFQHALITAGTVYLMRAFVLISTPLPNPFPNCESQVSSENSLLITSVLVLLKIKRTCGDVLFSGHAMSLTLFAMLAHKYLRRTEAIIITAHAFLSCFILIATRFHYTADVLVGVFLTVPVFALIDAASMLPREAPLVLPLQVLLRYMMPSAVYKNKHDRILITTT